MQIEEIRKRVAVAASYSSRGANCRQGKQRGPPEDDLEFPCKNHSRERSIEIIAAAALHVDVLRVASFNLNSEDPLYRSPHSSLLYAKK